MHVTLKTLEKMDALLDEAHEYIDCARKVSDDPGLKSAYVDLARCHYDGYENLSREAERMMERKRATMSDGEIYKEMCEWHKDKFDERATKIKQMLEQVR